MTFKQLREWLNELTENQLAEQVTCRDSDICGITLALTHGGVPFFVLEAEGDGDE